MTKTGLIKFYFMGLCGVLSLLSILLPWMSYGIGSKTGLDIGGTTIYIILTSGVTFLLFSYLSYKVKKAKRTLLYLTLTSSSIMFLIFLFELLSITYQTSIAKNLPVAMFGVASLATTQIHIGYGLWIGGTSSLFPCIINLIALKMNKQKVAQKNVRQFENPNK